MPQNRDEILLPKFIAVIKSDKSIKLLSLYFFTNKVFLPLKILLPTKGGNTGYKKNRPLPSNIYHS